MAVRKITKAISKEVEDKKWKIKILKNNNLLVK